MVVKATKMEDVTRKIVIVGDPYCGKTNLVSSFVNKKNREDKCTESYTPTIFETYVTELNLNKTEYTLSVHDTAGQDVYDRLRPLSYPDADAIIVCFSIDSTDSFHNAVDKWLPEIRHFSSNTPFILVGTKTDLRTDTSTAEKLKRIRQRFVGTQEAAEMSRKVKAKGYIECSTYNELNIDQVFIKALKTTIGKTRREKFLKRLKIILRYIKRHVVFTREDGNKSYV